MIPDCEYIDNLYANLKKLKPNQWYSIDTSRIDYKEFIATLKILMDVGEGIKIRSDYRAFKCVTEKEDFIQLAKQTQGVEERVVKGNVSTVIDVPGKKQTVKCKIREFARTELWYEGKLIAIY